MTPQNPLPTLSRQRLQDKTDILENNLFDTISKQTDRIKLHLQILRDQYPDPVIIKALLQLFPRINLHGKKIILLLSQLMARPIPEKSLLKTEKQLLDLSDSDSPNLSRLRLTLKIQISQKLLLMEISGTPEIPGRDGAIAQAFFDHRACPGLLLKDGVMDFREINKYPVVKAGDNLFFITPESPGKPGMSYDGRLIPIPQALPLEINLKEGVYRVDPLDEGEPPRGYYIRAGRTGVVVLTRSGQKITDIEIRDALEVKRLDYATGNIGTQFICPISMKIDTLCNGFKIRARERVEANVLEGGEIQTESRAQVHTLEPGSRIMARDDIIVNFARNSVLTSKEGTILVKNELIDSTLFSPEIVFESPRGIMTNNTLDAHRICLKNIYFCGENLIYFGRRLFAGEKALTETRKTLDKEKISLVIQGYLRRAACLKIFTGADEKDPPRKPHLTIESEKNQDTFIRLQGTYTPLEGFKITRS